MSPPPGLIGLTYACCDQVAAVRVNTYTAPAEFAELSAWFPLIPGDAASSASAPTAIVLPSSLNARDTPNWSPSPTVSAVPASPVFEALTYACCVHVAPRRVNTYTAPAWGIEWSA